MKKTVIATLFILSALLTTQHTFAQFSLSVGVSIRTAPPALPVYTQPPCPVEGWLWSPGYWAYDDIDGYYWVPGVWIAPPSPGLLWTPGYWGYAGGMYGWHAGYWGPHVGFYGGVNYGYGYGGAGFVGGEWHGNVYRYNTAITNVNTTVVHNTYINNTVINNTTVINNNGSRPSFNGGSGTSARPTAADQVAMRENHVQPTRDQFSHNQTARQDRGAFATANGGHPAALAMSRPGGERFGAGGRNAPAPQARPATAMRTGSNTAHPNNGPHPNVMSQGRMPQQQHVQPQQHIQPQQHPHPQPQRPEREGGGEHHRGR